MHDPSWAYSRFYAYKPTRKGLGLQISDSHLFRASNTTLKCNIAALSSSKSSNLLTSDPRALPVELNLCSPFLVPLTNLSQLRSQIAMSARRERKPLLRSCEPCRASKIRCMPDEVSDSKCQRCRRLCKSCVYSEVKSRTRKNVASHAHRVQDLERKIDRLSSLLLQAPDNEEALIATPDSSGPLLFDMNSNRGAEIDHLGRHLTPPDSHSG